MKKDGIGKALPMVIWLMAVLGSGFAPVAPSWAHGGATGVVKQRMDLMSAMGENMKIVAAMVKGQVPMDMEKVRQEAGAISRNSPKIETLFPAGSLKAPSEALPAVWEEWERFMSLSTQLDTAANGLQQAATTGDRRELTRRFVLLGKVCSGCHTDFRKKQE